MTIVKWNNSNNSFPLLTNFVDDVFKTDFSDFLVEKKANVPSANIKETAELFIIELAVPGMKKEEIKVDVNDYLLTILGQKEENTTEEKESYRRKEFNFTSWQRSFYLPKSANIESIVAKYEGGILNITVQKKDEAKKKGPKQIEIS